MLSIPWVYFLKDGEQLLIETPTRRRVLNGPCVATVGPLEKATKREGICIGPTFYARVCDKGSGKLRNEIGPKMLFLGPNDVLERMMQLIPLKSNEYVKIVDRATGVIRVVRGESSVILEPTESLLGEVAQGISVDEHTAVVVRNIRDGELKLITEHQLFVPAADQEVVEIRKCVLLDDHEAVVIRDRDGCHSVHTVSDAGHSFFLDPYSSLVQFRWSTGLHKDTRSLEFTHLDQRPKFMQHSVTVRTQDDVEVELGITVFWQVENIEAMLHTTEDAPADLCWRARSAIMQAASNRTLEEFRSSSNSIVADAVFSDGKFYAERGLRLHAIEVRSVQCRGEKSPLEDLSPLDTFHGEDVPLELSNGWPQLCFAPDQVNLSIEPRAA
ncbi:MAG: hypothetical protein HYS18_02175 [Burkholderiales bacterium]|nr:hypothetical protein [Burkholderiales bacterium]